MQQLHATSWIREKSGKIAIEIANTEDRMCILSSKNNVCNWQDSL